jgi:hypothetical protein
LRRAGCFQQDLRNLFPNFTTIGCIQQFLGQGDPRAGEVLEQVGQIRQAAARRSLLENIPWHREIRKR